MWKLLKLATLALFLGFVACSGYAYYSGYQMATRIAADLNDDGKGVLTEDQTAILLTVEDPRFYEHPGVSLLTDGAGLTTITQALVKRLMFDEFQPGILAKAEQTIYALAADSVLEKNDQLRLFIDNAYFGHNDGRPIIGFPSAANAFFGKDLQALTRAEFISLASRLIAPNDYLREGGEHRLADRMVRITAMLDGRCKPEGLLDVQYAACAQAE